MHKAQQKLWILMASSLVMRLESSSAHPQHTATEELLKLGFSDKQADLFIQQAFQNIP